MHHAFTITYDYLCPFARIANETVVEALRDGADWELTFSAFSLAQSHVDEGQPDVWDRAVGADGTRGVMALQLSLAVREHFPESFLTSTCDSSTHVTAAQPTSTTLECCAASPPPPAAIPTRSSFG